MKKKYGYYELSNSFKGFELFGTQFIKSLLINMVLEVHQTLI